MAREKEDTYDAFISYSSKDRKWVEKLVFILESKGADTWVDFNEIKAGDNIPEKINDGLEKSKFIVFVMTPDSLKSIWTKQETGYFRMALKEKKFIPLLFKDCNIPPLLTPILYLDFRHPDDFQLKTKGLLEALEIPDKKKVWTTERDKELHMQGKESYVKGKEFEKEVAETYRMLGFDVEEGINIQGIQFDLKIQKKDTGFLLNGFVECKETQVTAKVRDQVLAQHLTLLTTHPGAVHFVVSSRGYTEQTKTAIEGQGIQCFLYKQLLSQVFPLEKYVYNLVEHLEKWIIENLKNEREKRISLPLPINLSGNIFMHFISLNA